MEFTIKQSVLKEELGYIQGVVERKSTIPVLSNILIESIGENTIRITGTDLDVTIRCDAEAEIRKPGSVCIQARKLFDIVRTLDASDVHFLKEENEWVRMKAGRASFRLAGVNREQYPEIPNFKSAPLSIPANVLNYFIQSTVFAITNEQSRFTLSGAKFVVDERSAKMVTTDGHRLAFIEKMLTQADTGIVGIQQSSPIEEKENSLDVLVPKKALMELVKISREIEGEVRFWQDQNHIYFELDGRLLITRKLTGNFPNYEMVIPRDNDKEVIFDLALMRSAVRRISLMSDERSRSIRLGIRNGEIELIAASSEEGEAQETIPTEYNGEEIVLGFNHQYLQDFLTNIGTLEGSSEVGEKAATAEREEEEGENAATSERAERSNTAAVRAREIPAQTRVSLKFKDSNAATEMNIVGNKDYNYKYIVMPLRV